MRVRAFRGCAATEEEAAEAYDIAAIKFRGLNAVTNFEMSRYDVKSILEGSTLPVGGAARRLKEAAELAEAGVWRAEDGSLVSHLHTADSIGMGGYHHGWPTSIAFGGHQQQPSAAQHLAAHYPQYAGHGWCKTEQDAVIAAGHGAQDAHQELHLGTHNFFQMPASRTAVYGNGGGAWYQGLGGNAFMMPVGTTVEAGEHGHSGSTATTEEGRLVGYSADQGGVDPYAAMRRAYELSQGSSSVSVAKVADGYSNNWSSPFSGMG
jgi:AP2-like factor (ANT lineage)